MIKTQGWILSEPQDKIFNHDLQLLSSRILCFLKNNNSMQQECCFTVKRLFGRQSIPFERSVSSTAFIPRFSRVSCSLTFT